MAAKSSAHGVSKKIGERKEGRKKGRKKEKKSKKGKKGTLQNTRQSLDSLWVGLLGLGAAHRDYSICGLPSLKQPMLGYMKMISTHRYRE